MLQSGTLRVDFSCGKGADNVAPVARMAGATHSRHSSNCFFGPIIFVILTAGNVDYREGHILSGFIHLSSAPHNEHRVVIHPVVVIHLQLEIAPDNE